MWYECGRCVYATNSFANAEEHEAKTGHTMTSEKDWEDEDY